MKKIKYAFLILLVLFSFYFTNETAVLVRSKDPIMLNIKKYSVNNNINPVNAEIKDNYIIPGMYGKRINEVKSLMNMKASGVFNTTFLVTDSIKPEVSLKDHKDKIIQSGNIKKQAVSFIFENDETNALTYFISASIPADILVNKLSVNQNPYFEQINNDFNNFKQVETALNKADSNKHLCLVGRNNEDICLKNKQYLFEPSLILNEANLLNIKKNITSGSIVLVKSSVSIDNLSMLVTYLKSKNLSIIPLSKLISEN
jgi:hypothetical protein